MTEDINTVGKNEVNIQSDIDIQKSSENNKPISSKKIQKPVINQETDTSE